MKKGGIIEPKNLTKPNLLKYMEKVNNSEETVRKSKIKFEINSRNG
jgi:hypothetical protein